MSAAAEPNAETTKVALTAEELEAVELERKRKLHAELRKRLGLSKLQAQGPAGYSAYWARKSDETEMARLELLGFRIVRESSDPKVARRWKVQGKREDGTYVMGDVILMEIKTEDYEFYKQENSKRAAEMPEAAKRKFISDAEAQGAPTFKLARKG